MPSDSVKFLIIWSVCHSVALESWVTADTVAMLSVTQLSQKQIRGV